MWSGNVEDYDDSNLFMKRMVDSGAVTDAVFSFYLTDVDGDSYMDFGTPNRKVFSDPADLVYLDIVENDIWWTQTLTGFRWTKNSKNNLDYKLTSAPGLTDSGTSCIDGPKKEMDYIVDTIMSLVSWVEETEDGTAVFPCS